MKIILTTFLALTGSLALAQQHNSISQSISDDEKNLSIRVNGTVDGKPIDYDRTFDVSSLNKSERDALRERILDSLNIRMPEPPIPPTAPKAPEPPTFHSKSVTVIQGNGPTISASGSGSQVLAVGGKNPYTKEVNYDPESGQLFLRYRFQKDGEDFTYDRTVNARDKSQQERQRIIDGVEKEIGLPANSK
ncbi:hypothetical protein [Spirosoma validum]|uniref:DUF4136 domain-containing protein n=1 Tax=Spirosoma validum TaxID=2771355 RepID=A0A927AXG4_9BACT|nr:hypothetical protein [Spirosoma validum]MBD2751574.1 hypothetical protein [Spirosoma validum]